MSLEGKILAIQILQDKIDSLTEQIHELKIDIAMDAGWIYTHELCPFGLRQEFFRKGDKHYLCIDELLAEEGLDENSLEPEEIEE